MKVIELLNKIAKGEEVPNQFVSNGHSYTIVKYPVSGHEIIDYKDEDNDYLFSSDYELMLILNNEIEIIEEEKEIEKISDKTRYYFRAQNNGMTKTDREALDSMFETIYKTIDEILDELIKIKKEGK